MPATFKALLNKIFHGNKDYALNVYIDGPFFYSKDKKSCLSHLKTASSKLKKDQSFVLTKKQMIRSWKEFPQFGHLNDCCKGEPEAKWSTKTIF